MELGAVFPTTEIGTDPAAVRDYAQAAEDLGYSHLIAYDHVVGGTEEATAQLPGPYTKDHPFHEPFVLFGYLAGLTKTIELWTGIIILPQRQTTLVAKQAAEIDVLSGGRLVLGVGTGWNPIEYEALGEDFHTRGMRQVEQIELLRELWTKDVVDFEGRWDMVRQAGINPLPSRSIPIWFGGRADAVLRRIARIGNGWMPRTGPTPQAREEVGRLRHYAKEAGRDPSAIGVQAPARLSDEDPERWGTQYSEWADIGASHIAVITMDAGMRSVGDHIEGLRRYKEAVAE